MLRQQPDVEVVGLLTTFNEAAGRVAMHGVRRELVEQQAAAAGLPLWPVWLPWPCSNDVYEARMRTALAEARWAGVTHVAFGDLFLEDIRAYRIRLLDGSGLAPLFPIWTTPGATPALAREMLAAGLEATLTCVDPKQIDRHFAGRRFDAPSSPNCPLPPIGAANAASSTPSAPPGRCSRGRSASASERRCCATDSGSQT